VLFFLNAAQFFRCSFLFLNIHQTGDHDPLCLGRSGAVHGFRQASGDILGNARNFIGKPYYILFVNIGLLSSSALKFLLFFGFYG